MTGQQQDKLPLKPYSLKELSGLYHVSKNTFKKWIEPIQKKIGKREGYYYNIHQVEIIFEHLGIPGEVILAKKKD